MRVDVLTRRAMLAWLASAPPALAQGFGELGSDADGFAVPDRNTVLAFPADHGAHPAFRIEWWYVTANLKGEDGADYGIQWTLFRSALSPGEAPGWESPQIWMAHAALTTRTTHHATERFARGGIGQAGVTAVPFEAWIDDWFMRGRAPAGADQLSAVDLHAAGPDFSFVLKLDASGPLVLQGERGFSIKSAQGNASHYYSQPFYRVAGAVTAAGQPVQVTGRAWLDREWSSQPLGADQSGWDWFSLHFDSGEKLMGFRLRDMADGFTSATWIDPDGTPEPQAPGALRVTPLETATVAGRTVPVRWRVELPKRNLSVETTALNNQSWMPLTYAYWEGPVTVSGSHPGVGYVEMTGYT